MSKITIVGNLTADPELKFTGQGKAVANFTVAETPRYLDKASGEWRDGESTFWRCSIWREAAENVTESLTKGTRVIVTGETRTRSYETKEGEKRSVMELEVSEIGPSLKYAKASVTKVPGKGGGARSNGNANSYADANVGGGWGGSDDSDLPPF